MDALKAVSTGVMFIALSLSTTSGCSPEGDQPAGTKPDLDWPPDATAYFDKYGILSADCATDEDCAMVLGYYHAFDRFVQMDFRRRFATGRLSALFGKSFAEALVADIDADNRALFSTREGRPIEGVVRERASERTMAVLEAYSAGVNQWIDDVRNDRNGAIFPRELESDPFIYGPEDIPDWTPLDSLSVAVALIDQTTNRHVEELFAGEARALIDDDLRLSDMWDRAPFIESSILPPDWTPPQAALKAVAEAEELRSPRQALNAGPSLRRLRARLERSSHLRPRGSLGGSNNWAVSPSRSESGNALFAQDSHLTITQPSPFYLAHLDSKTNGNGDIHAAGLTAAGLPWIVMGQNENIAWGSTSAFFDLNDVYIEELVEDSNENVIGVRFNDEVEAIARVPFEIAFNDGSTERRELLFVPHHGPILGEMDVTNGLAITVRWTLQDAEGDIEYIDALNRAGDVLEARSALEHLTTFDGAFTMIDIDGNVGFFPYTRVPKRTWATSLTGAAYPLFPLDGGGNYEWTEFYDYAELPQALNPSEGFIASANNDMTGAMFDGDPTNDGYAPLQSAVRPAFRHRRITDLLDEIGDAHTPATMHEIQSDVYSLMGELTTRAFLAIANAEETAVTSRARTVVSVLEAWEFTCPTGVDGYYQDSPLTTDAHELKEAAGCAAFHGVIYNCRPLALRKPHAFAGPGYQFTHSTAYLNSVAHPSKLRAGDVYWDDPDTPEVETKFEVIGECFDRVGELLADDVGLGDDSANWAWGRAFGLALRSDLSAFGISQYDNPPFGQPLFANDGGLETIDATQPLLGATGWTQRGSAVFRLVCEAFPSGPKCTIQLPGGQSGHIESDNYEDLLFKYLDNEPIDLVFDIEEAKANAVRTVTFN